jgi:hypothetical protein
MSDDQLNQIVGKRQRLNELRRAKERVKQLERELRGEPRKMEEPVYVPEFLRPQVGRGRASPIDDDLPTNRPLPASAARLLRAEERVDLASNWLVRYLDTSKGFGTMARRTSPACRCFVCGRPPAKD